MRKAGTLKGGLEDEYMNGGGVGSSHGAGRLEWRANTMQRGREMGTAGDSSGRDGWFAIRQKRRNIGNLRPIVYLERV